MSIVGKLLNALTKRYQWDPRGIYWNTTEHLPATDPEQIHVGDIVEYAIEWPDNVRYQVQSINLETFEAKITVLPEHPFTGETYRAPLAMLRKPE